MYANFLKFRLIEYIFFSIIKGHVINPLRSIPQKSAFIYLMFLPLFTESSFPGIKGERSFRSIFWVQRSLKLLIKERIY